MRHSWARCATWRDVDSKIPFLAPERVIHGRFGFVRGNDSGTFSPIYESARGLCEKSWIKTKRGEGFFVYFRFYGPLEPFYDKTWKPGEIELVMP